MRVWACLSLLVVTILAAALAEAGNGAPAVAWKGRIDIASGAGVRGPWQQNESRYDFVDDPSVAIDERGEIAVAWVDQARKAVLFQRFSAEGKPLLAQPVDVSRQPQTFSWLPRVVLAPDAPREVFILWQEIIFSGGSHGGEMLFARSEDGGRSFSAPVNLSQSVPGDGKGRINKDVWHNGSYDLVAGAGGVLYAAWTEYDGPLWFSRSTDRGKTFSRPSRVAGDDALPARAPSLAVGPDRAVYLAWTVGEHDGADIHLARSTDGGATFDAPRPVLPSPGYSDAPKLAVDPRGVLHLVYAESAGGPFAAYHVRHSRSADGGRSFEAPRPISGVPDGGASAAFPHLAVDGAGRVLVLWELFASARQPPMGLAWAASLDGGRSFTPGARVPHSADPGGGSNGSSQGLLMKKLAVNAAGQLVVANSSLKPALHSRVWMVRGRLRPS